MALTEGEIEKLNRATDEIVRTVGEVFVQSLPEITARYGIDDQLAYFALGKAAFKLTAQSVSGQIKGRRILEAKRAEDSPDYQPVNKEHLAELDAMFVRLQVIMFGDGGSPLE